MEYLQEVVQNAVEDSVSEAAQSAAENAAEESVVQAVEQAQGGFWRQMFWEKIFPGTCTNIKLSWLTNDSIACSVWAHELRRKNM